MSAEWDDLASLAEAATPGPWEAKKARESDDHMITARSEHGHVWIANTAIPDDPTADAEFIAAANPATILRLIEDNRNLRHTTEADLEYQRRLEARLAAVEALLTDPNAAGVKTTGALTFEVTHIHASVLRAALSAAPTDTTKENNR